MTAGAGVEGLTFSYSKGGPPAIAGLDLAVGVGEILAVVGPSGSGKSTLLRLVCGLLTPDAGRVDVGGRDVTRLPPEQRPVALVFQGFALFPHLDIAANIGFGLAVRKVPRERRDKLVHEVAERLGIGRLLARRPGEISGGERQRVALARALMRDPLAFCLDEPLSSLDPPLRASARRDLDALLRQDGRCAFYVTHDQAEAMAIADRLAVINEGRLEQVGSARELYDDPASSFVAGFIGTPPMSLLPAGIAGLPAPQGAVTIGVRAEHVRIEQGSTAIVADLDDLGHELLAELEVEGSTLLARLARDRPIQRGARVGFSVDPGAIHGFDADGRAIT